MTTEQPDADLGPSAWMLEWSYDGDEVGTRLYDDERHCLADAHDGGGVCVALYRADAPMLALVQEVIAIAQHCALPDGDGVNVPTLLWAEDWMRRLGGNPARKDNNG